MSSGKATQLVIVESPAKAKTISRFLDDSYQVEASFGHVRDLPRNAKEIPAKAKGQGWARLGVNVEQDFEPLYVVPADKKKHVKRLKDALKTADRLLLATDEDREGESISWHVLQLLKPKKSVEVGRIVFHEVTKEAIEKAIQQPRELNEQLVKAQEARRILDRLYGYTLSPLLWKRVAPGLSAGRVQSVAVRLTVVRERRRIAFKPAEYWDLKAEVKAPNVEGDVATFKTKLLRVNDERIADSKSFDPNTGLLAETTRLLLQGETAEGFAKRAASAKPWRVTALKRKPGQQKPSPPFTTSTLQQEANRKLRFAARHTMRVAQQLYEGIELGGERVGLITYMRTDSMSLASRALEQARTVITAAYGGEYLPKEAIRYKTKAKRAEEAHEAIRPTDLARRPQDVARYLDEDQRKIYNLIWKRTLACQMLPARFERTAVEVGIDVPAGEESQAVRLTFGASGRRIVFPGFLRAYVEGSDDPEAQLGDKETLLPALEEGQEVAALKVEAEGHFTRPPIRYTEASLVKRLEEEGIGRPSTYASIITTVQDRGYVFKRGNELVPTFTAFCVTELLEISFRDLVDTEFTAKMENGLDEIASGEREWVDLLRSFYLGKDDRPGIVKRLEELELFFPAMELGEDPETGERLAVKIGRFGPYITRGEGGKGNTFSLPDDMAPDELTAAEAHKLLESKAAAAEALTVDPETGRNISVQVGRFGPYLELARTEEEIEEKVKPKRVSLPKGMQSQEITPEIALRLISLPRVLGKHPETGDEISTALGPYGPYVKQKRDFRSLTGWEQACDLTLDEALKILAEPKKSRRGGAATRTVLKELEGVEGAEGDVKVLDGRYGPYVTDGTVNASLPKGLDPKELTPEKASELLAARRAAGPKKKRRRRTAKR